MSVLLKCAWSSASMQTKQRSSTTTTFAYNMRDKSRTKRKQWSRTTYLYSIISLYWYIVPTVVHRIHFRTDNKTRRKKKTKTTRASIVGFLHEICQLIYLLRVTWQTVRQKVRSLFFVNLIFVVSSLQCVRVVREWALTWRVLNGIK